MQLRRTDTVNKTMASSFMIAGATIFCWTTAMGTAAANGVGQALLDGITLAAVAAFGCIGAVGIVRSKRHLAPEQRTYATAVAEPANNTRTGNDAPIAQAETPTEPAVPAANGNAGQSPTQRACRVLGQEHDLSLRERDVLDLMATGMTGKEIAAELTLSYNTVKSHIRHIYAKLDVHRKQDLADLIDRQRQLLEQQRIV